MNRILGFGMIAIAGASLAACGGGSVGPIGPEPGPRFVPTATPTTSATPSPTPTPSPSPTPLPVAKAAAVTPAPIVYGPASNPARTYQIGGPQPNVRAMASMRRLATSPSASPSGAPIQPILGATQPQFSPQTASGQIEAFVDGQPAQSATFTSSSSAITLTQSGGPVAGVVFSQSIPGSAVVSSTTSVSGSSITAPDAVVYAYSNLSLNGGYHPTSADNLAVPSAPSAVSLAADCTVTDQSATPALADLLIDAGGNITLAHGGQVVPTAVVGFHDVSVDSVGSSLSAVMYNASSYDTIVNGSVTKDTLVFHLASGGIGKLWLENLQHQPFPPADPPNTMGKAYSLLDAYLGCAPVAKPFAY